MYISSIRIENFRSFEDVSIEFHSGINVLIGENNSGKTTVIRALVLVFGQGSRYRPNIYDFYQAIKDYTVPPSIKITVTISSSEDDTPADIALVSTWLTRFEKPWQAQLTYYFSLPEEEKQKFITDLGSGTERNRFYETVEQYLPRYTARVYCGKFENRRLPDSEDINRFDCQFLGAIRDAETEMLSGRDPLLKRMVPKVLDRAASTDERTKRKEEFLDLSNKLVEHLVSRLDLPSLFKLLSETGAIDGGELHLSADKIEESDLIAALKLAITSIEQGVHEKIGLPLTHNGLGYNNLIYISLVLAEMDFLQDADQSGQNAKIFPMLLIEEPEAHLHPALQYRLLKYLKRRISEPGQCRQVFITTHSAHITAACKLDDIICLAPNQVNHPKRVFYPGKVFSDSKEDRESKRYIERFLDVTKSNMLFSRGIIFVEGIAEQLVVPCLAELLGTPLEDYQVGLIMVGGSTFKHFLKLFGAGCGDNQRDFAINRPVACIVDADPLRKSKKPKSKWEKCWPVLLDNDMANYNYKVFSGTVRNLIESCRHSTNVKILYGVKTFEYDLARENISSNILIGQNYDFKRVWQEISNPATISKVVLQEHLSDENLCDAILGMQQREMLSTLFATCYLLSVESEKGENALAIAESLRNLIESGEKIDFYIPTHISDAIKWACKKEV